MEILLTKTASYWALQTVAMAFTALLIPRLRITSLFGAFGAVVGLAFVNATIWDAALFCSIPNSLSAHALLLLFTNGVIFWLLVKLLPGIEVDGILPTIVAPLVFTALSLFIHSYGADVDWQKVFEMFLGFMEQLKAHFESSQ